MVNTGRRMYVPKKLIDELANVKANYNIDKNCKAFDKMAELAPVAMEFEKMQRKFFLLDLFEKKKKDRHGKA